MSLLADGTATALSRVLALHTDPGQGSPFWRQRQEQFGFALAERVRHPADLPLLGPFPREELLRRPLSDFVPVRLWRQRAELVLAESGGTSGRPTRCVYTRDEFMAAFGAPFTAVSGRRGFPRGAGWLFVGPGGPHVIGRAARLLAALHDAAEPFTVDLDPRWARAQAPGSLGARLYREHVLAQALDVLAREDVGVLFITPPLARELAAALPEERRAAIRGVHLGGMALDPDEHRALREAYPRAVVLPGYGNSMLGLLMPVAEPDATCELDYFVPRGRLLVDVVAEDEQGVHLDRPLPPGATGRVVASRLDPSFLLLNLVERDRATVVEDGELAPSLGFATRGLRRPHPVEAAHKEGGLY